ncbi:DUF1800 domain-containing protein [Loktanella agnita]|uniref:DUF1800 domain-containing protein n=1 Tax=Loktanella agnita TaxID=287097 RepID=UPI00398783FC
MNDTGRRLLTLTPLILATVTGTAFAQETSIAAINARFNSSALQQEAETKASLNLNAPVASTYSFSAPANAALQLRVDGDIVLDLSAPSNSSEAVTALVSLSAGDHVIEVSGTAITNAKLATVQINQVGMAPTSFATLLSVANEEKQNNAQIFPSPQSSVASVLNSSSALSTTSKASLSQTLSTIAASATLTNRESSEPNTGSNNQQRSSSGGVARSAISGAVGAILAAREAQSSGGGGGGGGSAPDVPVDIPAGAAISSPLSPPVSVDLTQAVEIVAGPTDEGMVASNGQTLFGGVMDPETYDTVTVTIAESERSFDVDVGPTTGQFAVRLFPEDLTSGQASLTLTGTSSSNDEVMTMPVSYTFQAATVNDGLSQALSRISFGPEADLYNRVRMIGFTAYVNEQLNPGSINDSSFENTDPDGMLELTTRNVGVMNRSIMRHNLAYAAFSDKQLNEVMGEFWNNHFFASTKGTDIRRQNFDDRDFYRDNAMGRFEDLLLYSARSPLMSQFLDNDLSRRGNINENYAREILELHTVGVNGGYSAEDVIAVARVFTGWRYRRTNSGDVASIYEFEFQPDRHDADDKTIAFLDTTIAGRAGDAGVQEGEELIALLAADPRTQNFVCGKIVQRFVADVPPQEFIDLCVAAWEASDGSSREMLRAILTAPAYIENAEYQRNKTKTPYEHAASAIRALGARPAANDADGNFYQRFVEVSTDGGYDPLEFDLPTGLPETADAWVSSASQIARYRKLTDIVERQDEYNIDIGAQIEDAGLETAEEVAAYLLTIATADRFTREEYETLVGVLKGEDGIFEPNMTNETSAFNRATGMLVVMPSFELQ